MPTRTARTGWTGTLENGSGQVEMTSSGVGTYEVSFPRRAADDAGGYTSPEELIAAAHSACYAMQLSALIGQAGGTPQASWRPSISSVNSTSLAPGKTYALSGKQLAGLDQGATYGDDVQDNTNFPLVRITNSATGAVTYARTSNWTSVSVAPGTRSATKFTLPPGTPAGKSTLVVVANGIASAPVKVTVK